jgi:hypothetical protein
MSYVFKDSPHKELAKAWISEVMHGELYVKWLDLLPGQNLPVRESTKANPAYNANPLLSKYADSVKVLQQQTASAGSFSRESPQHKVNTQGGVIGSGPILTEVVQRVLVNNESPKSAVAWGHKELVDLMKDAVKL